MLPQRERIVRKAKERTIDYSMSNFNNRTTPLQTTPGSNSQTPTKRNARSYKPFTNTTNVIGAMDLNDGGGGNEDTTINTSGTNNANDSTYYETPPKKVKANATTTTTRQQNKTTTSKTNRTTNGAGGRTTTNRINVSKHLFHSVFDYLDINFSI